MQHVVVKIDVCGSKAFASQHQSNDPSIRTDVVKQLVQICQTCFPDSAAPFPEGSFYKADGDAIYYLLEKPSVALRSAVEFMQMWFYESVPKFPDCRVFLDRSAIESFNVPGKVELTGTAFENISVIEKGQQEGKVYVTESVVQEIDSTMVKFSFLDTITPRPGHQLKLYCVEFDDPRTVSDSSLIHALFIAHPQATKARDRVFELFLIEYLLEYTLLRDFGDFHAWSSKKNYPVLNRRHLEPLIESSRYFEKFESGWRLTEVGRREVEDARAQYSAARTLCVDTVKQSLLDVTKRKDSHDGLDVAGMIEEYLSGVFSEVRIMANYFRSTLRLFDSPPELERFDYLLRRRLDATRLAYYTEWRRGFISGLKGAATADNPFIAAVFHNVLAIYYLNRSFQTSPYQIERLKRREIFLDTNVLYSFQVEASPFHEVVRYFVERLSKMEIKVRVFPISLWEYEESLLSVARNFNDSGPKEPLVRKNPWLYQQFKSDASRFVGSMAVCRQSYSLAKDLPIKEANYSELDTRLAKVGIALETRSKVLTQDEADAMWDEHRNWMTSNKWGLDEYWDFIHSEFPPSVRLHDMTCLASLTERHEAMGEDALGPKIIFITVDGKLWRMRGRYPFICSPEQFLEFILPYLFLSDLPLTDAKEFPNRLLSAQLGTLLVSRPPELVDIVRAYFRNPTLAFQDPRKVFADVSEDMAKALSNERFRKLVTESEGLTDAQRAEVADQAAILLEEVQKQTYTASEKSKRVDELEADLRRQQAMIEKLQRTLAYWRAEARRE